MPMDNILDMHPEFDVQFKPGESGDVDRRASTSSPPFEVGFYQNQSLPTFRSSHRQPALNHELRSSIAGGSISQLNDFYHNSRAQVTKLRCAEQSKALLVPDHVAQVVAPSCARGSGSSAYPSSDESSCNERRSPTSLAGIVADLGDGQPHSSSNHHQRMFVGDVEGQTQLLDQRLLDLQNHTGYTIVQRNGQRIYGPPPDWTGEQPTKGSEVFVGRVPRDCFEPELVPVFQKVGQIYELRLMMDFSGSNRGFFFVRYTCREDAKRAVAELNNYEIRPNKRLGVLMSLDNNKLWISGIPNNVTAEDIKAEVQQKTDGVKKVILCRSQTDKSKPRKYAFVEYQSHRAAALARRQLVPNKVILKGQEAEKIDWAEPENEVDEEIMSTVRVLFVRNLTETTSEEMLRGLFEQWSGGLVERVKKAKDYAFVHFANRQAAELAKQNAIGQTIDGEKIEVEWSKPVDKTIYNTRKYLTKVLSSPTPQGFECQPIPSMLNCQPMCSDGLRGAPGTQPPRNLLRKLTGNVKQRDPLAASTSSYDPAIIKALCELKLSQNQPQHMYQPPPPVGHQSLNGSMMEMGYFPPFFHPHLPAPLMNPVYYNFASHELHPRIPPSQEQRSKDLE